MSTPPILLLKPENCHFLYRDVVSVDVVPLKKGCFRRGAERKNLKHDRFALVVDVLDPLVVTSHSSTATENDMSFI